MLLLDLAEGRQVREPALLLPLQDLLALRERRVDLRERIVERLRRGARLVHDLLAPLREAEGRERLLPVVRIAACLG